MAATKGGLTLNFLNYNPAQENNVSNAISGPPTPLLHEKNNFTRCTQPSEIIELVDDPHQYVVSGRLHQTSLVTPPNPAGIIPMPTPTRRMNQPDASALNLKMLPQMGYYQAESLPVRINQSGLLLSNHYSGAGFSNDIVTYMGSPSIHDVVLLGIGRGSMSDTDVLDLMTIPQSSTYWAMQQKSTANESDNHLSSYSSMPPYYRQLKHTSTGLNFGMLPQPGSGSLLIRPDIRYPSVTEPSSTLDKPPQGSGQEGTPYQEMVPTEEVATNQVTLENQGIDLNKTPQQKRRRRKYMPKVVKEGKKKARAPKRTTPKKPSEDRPKRKYVRKKVVEPSPVETPVNANVAGTLAEVSIPCSPNVTVGLNNLIDDVSSPCTPKCVQRTNTMDHPSNHCTTSGMNRPHMSVRRRLNFDAHEAGSYRFKDDPQTTSSPSPSKGITLDLNGSAAPWQEDFDLLFPPASSGNIGGARHTFGTSQTAGRNASNVNPVPSRLGILTDYPYLKLPCQTNSSTFSPTTSVNQCEMGKYQEMLATLAKDNGNLNLESLTDGNISHSNSYSYVPTKTSDERKRDYNTLVGDAGLRGQVRAKLSPRIIETSKKMRIWNGNNTRQNETRNKASSVINSSLSLSPVRLGSRVFSLPDTKMLSSKIQDGNTEKSPDVSSRLPCTSTSTIAPSNYQLVTFDENRSASTVNEISRGQIHQSGAFIKTFSERTATLNQHVNTSGTELCDRITPVISGMNRVTLEMLTGSRYLDGTSTKPPDPIIQPHATNGVVRNENCQIGATRQIVSEITSDKAVTNSYTPQSTPEKPPRSNAPPKSTPKRRRRRPKSENTGPHPQASLHPKGKPCGKKSSCNSTNLMVNGPAALECTLDLIIQKMSRLDINRIGKIVPSQQCYALVPYQNGVGDNGAIVPYDDGVAKKKKRKSRAQVNLDPVTTQVWNLLMGKEMKDGIDTVNDEKVMEGEREVFRGRVDSFIARMHLVQGDRRFSPWKGSVVDSVVGVFLTQNVSDHLSSSAFIALVAKYPLKTQLHSLPRESTLSRPCNTIPYARDFIDLTKWHRQREVIIEDFTEIGSQVTSEEKNNNESQGSTAKCPGNSPEKKLTGSPDSGPALIINFPSEGPISDCVISSQNSVVSNQSSPDYLFQTGEQNLTGLSLFGNYNVDEHVGKVSVPVPDLIGTHPTSYTQLLRMAESNGIDFSSDLNKEANTMFDGWSYSNMSQIYHQSGNDAHMSSMYPRNLGNSPPVAPTMINGNKFFETFQTQDSEPTIRTLHSPMVSRTQEPITPMTKMTPTSAQGYRPVQEENNLCQMKSNQKPVQQPQPQAQSTRSASHLQNTSDANNNQNSKASLDTVQRKQKYMAQKVMDGVVIDDGVSRKGRKGKGASRKAKKNFDWDSLRRAVCPDGVKKERTYKTMDSLDYEALRNASVNELSDAIKERGMNNMLAERIKGFLDRTVNDHGSIDLEWLRDVDPDKAKDYLLSIRGLGLKSVEWVRLLTLHHMAFPVDTNVGRICVRLGWVPLQPLPESLQLHLLEMYPILENIQKYLWPRLCKLDQRTLYELHYQMITFGKVFCTKSKPNCNACPMRAECKHFASAFASARLALPAPEEKGLIAAALPAGSSTSTNLQPPLQPHAPLPQIEGSSTSSSIPLPFPNQPHSQIQPQISNTTRTRTQTQTQTCNEPIIEEPASPEPEPVVEKEISAIEDAFLEDDPDEIPVIKLDIKEFTQNLKSYFQANNLEIEGTDMSKAMVAISHEAASIPVPKLKNVSRLRTEHLVYELPDNHTLLNGYEPREPDDPSPYLLSIWTPGENAMSTEPPKLLCISQDVDELCDKEACARCAGIKESRSKIVRGTILIPCRTAMRGSFPLNGTYFQVNEVFADHETSRTPIDISRSCIWNPPRRTVYFGTSIPTIFKGQSTEEIQHCFWRGFVCVRGFDRATRAPRPLYARLHFPASKLTKNNKRSAAAKVEE